MNRLLDYLVVVTGASGLLGQQHAKAVLEEGGSVILLDVDEASLSVLLKKLSAIYPGKVFSYNVDLTSEQELISISKDVFQNIGIPNGLINNAAINPSVEKNNHTFTRIENLSLESWNLEISVGLTGSFLTSRIFGAQMVENSIQGSIINISSDHGLIAPNQSLYRVEGLLDSEQPVKPVTYSVIKHGLIGLTKYLSTYWAMNNIRVNTLCPGGVLNGQNQEFLGKFNEQVPLGRPARPDEYKGAIQFMLSNESSYMTGATIVIDGGRTVW